MADDFVLVTGSGKTYNKADLLNEALSGRVVYDHQEDTAQNVRIWGDTATITNRVTAPAGVTFVDDNVAQNVPTNALASAETIGVWWEENLPANDFAHRTTFTSQLSGTTI